MAHQTIALPKHLKCRLAILPHHTICFFILSLSEVGVKPKKGKGQILLKYTFYGYDLELLKEVIGILASGQKLPAKNRDHAFSGNFSNYRECHISPDWLLIYEISGRDLILYLTRTGIHSDLF